MGLLNLRVTNFRNIENANIDFGKNNVFFGKNGQGKTNILEALYYSLVFKSFRTSINDQLIKSGNKETFLNLDYLSKEGVQNKIDIRVEKNGKDIFWNSKKLLKTSLFEKTRWPFIFSNEVVFFFKNFPSYRRRFFDQQIALETQEYIADLKDYKRIIQQKNKILRSTDNEREISVWNELLSDKIVRLCKQRKKYVQELNLIISKTTEQLFEKRLSLSLIYIPSIEVDYLEDFDEAKKKVNESLTKKLQIEKKRQRCLIGTHLDFYKLSSSSQGKGSYLSSGEYSRAIYFLQFCVAEKLTKKEVVNTVFLLDDVFLDIDAENTHILQKYINQKRGQLFFCITDRQEISLNDTKLFEVKEGKVKII